MKRIIILVAFALVSQLTEGANPPKPEATVTCIYDHTVDIVISNVDDANEWVPADWRLANKSVCDPVINVGASTVTYTALLLPDCTWESEQLADHIKYILKISTVKPNPGGTGQLRAYDHLYYVSCYYDNQNRTSASFVPIKNRKDNDTDYAFFSFTLEAFEDVTHTKTVPNPVALNKTIYFKATVVTQSAAPNFDLFPVKCWSSKSVDPHVANGDFTLIENGCGSDVVSKDLGDTLDYTCTENNETEKFSLQTYRYFEATDKATVYIHCDLRVCLADETDFSCECPSDPNTCNGAFPVTRRKRRKRRSIADSVNELQLYHVASGPYTFKKEEVNKEEVGSEKREETDQSFRTLAIVGAVCGVLAVSGMVVVAIICATAYLVTRKSKKSKVEAATSAIYDIVRDLW